MIRNNKVFKVTELFKPNGFMPTSRWVAESEEELRERYGRETGEDWIILEVEELTCQPLI